MTKRQEYIINSKYFFFALLQIDIFHTHIVDVIQSSLSITKDNKYLNVDEF